MTIPVDLLAYMTINGSNVLMTEEEAAAFRQAIGAAAVVNVRPQNATIPVITGTVGLGETLSGSDGTWVGENLTFTYRWLRNGVAITGATDNTYDQVAADDQKLITFEVRGTNTFGTATGTSDPLGPLNFFPGLINGTMTNLAGVLSSIEAVQTGAATKRWAAIGDSGTAPYTQPSGGGSYSHLRSTSWAAILNGLLASEKNCPSSTDSCFGYPFYENTWDARGTGVVAGWAGVGFNLGGGIVTNTTTTNACGFTPTYAFDSYTLTYCTYTPGSGDLTVYLDGVLHQTIDTDLTSDTVTATFTCPLGVHAVTIKRTTDACELMGFHTQSSITPRMLLNNWGTVSSTTLTWSEYVDGRDPPTAMASTTMDWCVIELGEGDIVLLGASAATIKARMGTIIDNAKAMCDDGGVILILPWFSNYSPGAYYPISIPAQQAVIDALIDLCAADDRDIPCLDVNNIPGWGISPAIANSNGNLGGDFLHPTVQGQSVIGTRLFNCLYGAA